MARRAAIVTLCIFLSSCIGYRETKLPANVINGTIGGIGVLATAAIYENPGDNGGASTAGAIVGLGLVIVALLGATITASMPDPEVRTESAPQLIPAIDSEIPPAPPDPDSWPE